MLMHERLRHHPFFVNSIYTVDDDNRIFRIQSTDWFLDEGVEYSCIQGVYLNSDVAHVDIFLDDECNHPILCDCDQLIKTPR